MVQQTVKFGGWGVMMWGCMTPSGLGMMCRIEGRMDHYMYREVLERELIHTLHAYNLDHAISTTGLGLVVRTHGPQ
jgi:hypothetical protein